MAILYGATHYGSHRAKFFNTLSPLCTQTLRLLQYQLHGLFLLGRRIFIFTSIRLTINLRLARILSRTDQFAYRLFVVGKGVIES